MFPSPELAARGSGDRLGAHGLDFLARITTSGAPPDVRSQMMEVVDYRVSLSDGVVFRVALRGCEDDGIDTTGEAQPRCAQCGRACRRRWGPSKGRR